MRPFHSPCSALILVLSLAACTLDEADAQAACGLVNDSPGFGGGCIPVCHLTGGGRQILYLPPAAIPAHLAHGDNLVSAEACDGIDNDCDGAVDEAGAIGELTFYADLDGDGFGDPARPQKACIAPPWTLLDNMDCDDTRADVNPGETEIAGNAVDEDCDGVADPNTYSWRQGPVLPGERLDHFAVLLSDYSLMIGAGFDYSTRRERNDVWLLDLRTLVWTQLASMSQGRHFHAGMTGAVKLRDGRVLVVGGYAYGSYLGSAELYNPATNSWKSVQPHYVHGLYFTLTSLADGRILAVGGNRCGSANEAGAEIFDPTTDQWTRTTSLPYPKSGHAGVLLKNGDVLVAGGVSSATLGDSYIYSPTNQTWTRTGSLHGEYNYTQGVLLPDGKALLGTGQTGPTNTPIAAVEIYDPATGTWTLGPSLSVGRHMATMTVLPDGQVAVVGGCKEHDCVPSGALGSVELFNPATKTWTAGPSLLGPRASHSATLLPSGEVVAAGGRIQRELSIATTEILTRLY